MKRNFASSASPVNSPDGVLPSSQRNKLREILDARDDITIESGESKDELQQMVDKYG